MLKNAFNRARKDPFTLKLPADGESKRNFIIQAKVAGVKSYNPSDVVVRGQLVSPAKHMRLRNRPFLFLNPPKALKRNGQVLTPQLTSKKLSK